MGHLNVRKYFPRVLAVLLLSLMFGPMPPHKVATSGGTGWCSDYEGNNFRCSDTSDSGGDGDYGYGGGGCANTYANSNAGNDESGLLDAGNSSWDQGDFESAAGMYQHALDVNPANVTARGNLGEAVNQLGVKTYNAGNYESAWLYFNRAIENGRQKNLKTYEQNLTNARGKMSGSLDCSMCSKAIISDIGYGLDNSASFLSYANQASANFNNCTLRISDTCTGTNGKWLNEQIANCWYNIQSSSGVRACIEQSWQSVK